MNELIQALEQLQAEKGIDKEVIFEAIEASLVTACKKNFGTSQNITVNMDRKQGTVKVLAWKNVVEEVADAALEISLEDAVKINANYKVGDVCEIEVTPKILAALRRKMRSRLLCRSCGKRSAALYTTSTKAKSAIWCPV